MGCACDSVWVRGFVPFIDGEEMTPTPSSSALLPVSQSNTNNDNSGRDDGKDYDDNTKEEEKDDCSCSSSGSSSFSDDDDEKQQQDAQDRLAVLQQAHLSPDVMAALTEFQQLGGRFHNDDDDNHNNNTVADREALCTAYRPQDTAMIASTLRRLLSQENKDDTERNDTNNIASSDNTANDNHTSSTEEDVASIERMVQPMESWEFWTLPTPSLPSTSIDDNSIVVAPPPKATTTANAIATVLQEQGVARINNVLSPALCLECLQYINGALEHQEPEPAAVQPESVTTTSNAALSETPATSSSTSNNGFGNVFERRHRWDMYLRDAGVVDRALQFLLHTNTSTTADTSSTSKKQCDNATTQNQQRAPSVSSMSLSSSSSSSSGILGPLFLELLDGRSANFHELSSLVADPGCVAQPIHPDAPAAAISEGDKDDSNNDIRSAPLWTCFVALQDVAPDMGGTVFLPRSHTAERHALLKQRTTHDETKQWLQTSTYYRADLRAGDCVVMDARTLHYGGANLSASTTNSRRVLLYFTIRNPLHASNGYPPCGSLFANLDGVLTTAKYISSTFSSR